MPCWSSQGCASRRALARVDVTVATMCLFYHQTAHDSGCSFASCLYNCFCVCWGARLPRFQAYGYLGNSVLQGVYSMLKQAHPHDILSFYLRRHARNIQTKHVFPSAVCAPLLFHIAPIKELSLLNASLKSHVFPCACCSEKSHVAALIRISFAPLSRLSAL